jgi:Uma2 family endonuclease
LSEREKERYLPFAPDFLIEILSPSDSLAKLDAKMAQWIANGVRLAWRIDPFGCTVAVHAPGRAPVVLDRPEIVEGRDPVAGFRLKMERVWA